MAFTKLKAAVAASIAALVLALVAAVYVRAEANSLTIIVSRDGEYVELFVGLPAEAVDDVFDLPESKLLSDNGKIEFAKFQRGTWELGDRLLASVDARTDNAAVSFEAMSLMLHPSEDYIPFNDFVDAALAVSVCNAITRPAASSLTDLDVYAGYFAIADKPGAEIKLVFPQTGRFPVLVKIREYSNGRLAEESWKLLSDVDNELLI